MLVFHHETSVFVVCCWSFMFGSLRLPLLLLHVLQMIWPLSRVLSPPLLTGVMWSASGLVGRSCVSQSMVTPQSGQVVCPCLRACVMSRCRQRRCAADAVRLVCAIASPILDCASMGSHCSCNGLESSGGMNTLHLPCRSILGAVLCVWRGVLFVPGCLFSLPTPWHVKKITSPPSCVKKRRTRKKNGGVDGCSCFKA